MNEFLSEEETMTPGEADELGGRLLSGAGKMFDANFFEGEGYAFHMPSASQYRSFFAWDSGWHVIGLAHIDAEKALAELETIFSFQAEDGRIPHEVRIKKLEEKSLARKAVIYIVGKQFDTEGRSMFIDPPSYLLAASLLYERAHDERVLQLLPAMERYVEYLLGPRDLFGHGLVSIIHPWESGTDSAPVFDAPLGIDMKKSGGAFKYGFKYPRLLKFNARRGWDLERIAKANRFVLEDLTVNSLTAAGLKAMENLYNAAGDMEKAEKCAKRAAAMVSAMEKLMWDEKAGFFFPRWDVENPKLSRRKCLSGFLPLITGLVDDDKASGMIENHLLSPDHFWAKWPVGFNSVSELEGDKIAFENVMLWRGKCVWASMNWMAARAASMYGRDDVARAITRRTAAMIDRAGFREFYHPQTGEGGGARNFTWPALALDMIERYGM